LRERNAHADRQNRKTAEYLDTFHWISPQEKEV
jgi:hypothetical protein